LNQGVSGDALWENEYPFFFFPFLFSTSIVSTLMQWI
jgi:hypothetical protein